MWVSAHRITYTHTHIHTCRHAYTRTHTHQYSRARIHTTFSCNKLLINVTDTCFIVLLLSWHSPCHLQTLQCCEVDWAHKHAYTQAHTHYKDTPDVDCAQPDFRILRFLCTDSDVNLKCCQCTCLHTETHTHTRTHRHAYTRAHVHRGNMHAHAYTQPLVAIKGWLMSRAYCSAHTMSRAYCSAHINIQIRSWVSGPLRPPHWSSYGLFNVVSLNVSNIVSVNFKCYQCKHTETHAHTRTHRHAYTRTHVHTYTNMHAHAYSQPLVATRSNSVYIKHISSSLHTFHFVKLEFCKNNKKIIMSVRCHMYTCTFPGS